MASNLIDVWDAKTFDAELSAHLEKHADLIRNYLTTDRQIFLDYDMGRQRDKFLMRPQNPHAPAFLALQEQIMELMRTRIMRAWHYTRITKQEIETLRNKGIHLSTPETLRARLDFLVASDLLSGPTADALYAASPFHSDQLDARSGKFWMASHPVHIDDGGVQPLMAHWGGEVASMWVKDPVLLAPLAGTGIRCVLELAVPLALTNHGYSASGAILATFGRALACISGKHDFDLYVTTPLPPDRVIKVHTEGDPSFNAIGISYPEGYVDVDVGYWEALTGESD